MSKYDQQGQQVKKQTNVAGNATGVNIGDVNDGIHDSTLAGRDIIFQVGSLKISRRVAILLATVLLILVIAAVVNAVSSTGMFITSTAPMPDPTATQVPTPTPLPISTAGEDEILIVIARFSSTGQTDAKIHQEIQRAIKAAADEGEFSDLRVEVEPTTVLPDARSKAEILGNQYDASIVIWGEDTGVRVTVNYLNLKQTEFDAAAVQIDEIERTQLANPSAFARFVTQDLPYQLTFLSLFAIGQSYYLEEDYAKAITTIEQAVNSLSPDTPVEGLANAYFRLGWLYQVSEEKRVLEKAIANYTQAIAFAPNNTAAYNNRGATYTGQGEYEKAIADFSHALALAPNNTAAYNNRGATYDDQGEYEKAIADYDKTITLDPNHASAYYNRGLTYNEQGEYEKAIADFSHAITLDYDPLSGYYYNRGLVYTAQGEYKKAIANFTHAINLDPSNATYHNYLCWYGTLMGGATEVLDNCERAVELSIDDSVFARRDSRGLARALTGDYEGAIEDFRAYVRWTKEENEKYKQDGVKREKWIADLEAGRNPFDEETLEELK